MNRRKAKKKIKRELGLSRWPGSLPPRLVNAIFRDMKEAYEEALDYSILFGSTIKPPRHRNRFLNALTLGTKPGPKYTEDFLLPDAIRNRFAGNFDIDVIRRLAHDR